MLINHGVVTKPLVFSLISAQNTLPTPKTKWFGKFVHQEELDPDLVLPPVNGYNLRGMLMIPNKSPIAFGIGDYTLDDIIYKHWTASSTSGSWPANMGAVVKSMAPSLADGMMEVTVTGRECYINGQRLTLIENILNHRSFIIHGSVATLLADLVGDLLMAQLDTGHGTNRGSSFINAISTVFSNQTLMGNIADHWNKTKKRSEGGTQ
ncbi:hypothetical protein NHJ13734_000200 [Beauveria thailandica]